MSAKQCCPAEGCRCFMSNVLGPHAVCLGLLRAVCQTKYWLVPVKNNMANTRVELWIFSVHGAVYYNHRCQRVYILYVRLAF